MFERPIDAPSYGSQNGCISRDPRPLQMNDAGSEAPMELVGPAENRARQITIEPQNYGYLVRVGCQSYAIESADKLTRFLKKYLNNPQAVETLWFKGELGLED